MYSIPLSLMLRRSVKAHLSVLACFGAPGEGYVRVAPWVITSEVQPSQGNSIA